MRVAIVVAALLAAPAAGMAQQALAPSAAQLAAMRPFDRWLGEWRGSGWAVSATGERTEFTIVENVQRRVGGTVLLLDGRGTATGTSGPERVTHDGLVVLSYDEKTGTYHWDGHELGRDPVNVEATLVNGGLAWSLPVGPGGATVRFTITFDERRWHEVGEFSPDGSSWVLFMEMSLLRQ